MVDFLHFTIKPGGGTEYNGTYFVTDNKKNLIAKTEGISIHHRHISYSSKINNFECDIYSHKFKKYNFRTEDKVNFTFRQPNILLKSKLILNLENSDSLVFTTQDFSLNYYIGFERINIGIISFPRDKWSEIKIRLTDMKYANEIFCAVIVMDHYNLTFDR